MIQLCPQLKCTASYQLDDGDEGKTFRCEQCGSLLLFEAGSLAVISGPDAEKSDPPRSLSLGTDKGVLSPAPTDHQTIAVQVFSWFLALLFAIGSLLIVLFFFLPLIDQSGLARQQAKIDAGDRQQLRLDDKLWGRNARRNPRDPFGDRFFDKGFEFKGGEVPQPNEEAQKKRKNERAEWEKTRDKLEDELEDSRGAARNRTYYYTWGMLFGFLILAFASVGFLSFGPTTTRRVFGGIVISAEILLIFAAYFVAHNALRFNPFP